MTRHTSFGTGPPLPLWAGSRSEQEATLHDFARSRLRSTWGADLYAAVRSVIGPTARRGINAHQAIRTTLQGQSVVALRV